MTFFPHHKNVIGAAKFGINSGILVLALIFTITVQAQSIYDVNILSGQDSNTTDTSSSNKNHTTSTVSSFTSKNGIGADISRTPNAGQTRNGEFQVVSPAIKNKRILQTADHLSNQISDVFGAQLFTGAFSIGGSTQFNPDYVVAIGDQLQVRLWGAFSYEGSLTVDPKGNIFLPHAGPVRVLGVRNDDIQHVVHQAISKTFKNNVRSYASLAAAQPVRVFVGGNVNRPGLYNGTSMDGVLHYIDMAGGVDAERGSYLHIQVKRGGRTNASVNLYDFLLHGNMPLVQLADGDVIFVPPYTQRVKVTGMVNNAKRFEFDYLSDQPFEEFSCF